MQVETGTILDEILTRTATDLAERKRFASIGDLDSMARGRPAPLSLRDSLRGPPMAVIAEIKRASPSRGAFPIHVDPAAVARDYVTGGAAALSVLTDEPFFQGSLHDLDAAAKVAHDGARPIPVLRKDFIVDPYQIVEARAYGADAVLLIVAALHDVLLATLLTTARDLGMNALVEVHDEPEMARAARVGADLVGINNRDLKTFAVDLAVTERLAPLAPANATIVAESGVFGPMDVKRLYEAGAHAVLVGEGVIIAADRAAAVRSLVSWAT